MKTVKGLGGDDEHAATLFRALGNPARLLIVLELAARNACVTSDLVGVLPLAQSTVSQHLKVLKEAGLVQGELDAEPCYCLDPQALRWLADFCGDLERHASSAPVTRAIETPV